MSSLKELLTKLTERLQDLDAVKEVITPLPLENYVSLLLQEIKNLQEATASKKLDLMILYCLRGLALLAQLTERLVDILELRNRLGMSKAAKSELASLSAHYI